MALEKGTPPVRQDGGHRKWSGPGGIRWDLVASVMGVPNGHEDPHCLDGRRADLDGISKECDDVGFANESPLEFHYYMIGARAE